MKPNKKTLSKDKVFFRLYFSETIFIDQIFDSLLDNTLLVQLAALYEKLGGLLIHMSLVQVQ